MPNVLLEAMSAGTPVIVPDRPYAAFLEDGLDCIKYPYGDTDHLVQALMRIKADPTLAGRLAQHGRSTAAMYSIDSRVRLLMKMADEYS
jgi:glycosyltransferase involved in cell wall biosynthesis